MWEGWPGECGKRYWKGRCGSCDEALFRGIKEGDGREICIEGGFGEIDGIGVNGEGDRVPRL